MTSPKNALEPPNQQPAFRALLYRERIPSFAPTSIASRIHSPILINMSDGADSAAPMDVSTSAEEVKQEAPQTNGDAAPAAASAQADDESKVCDLDVWMVIYLRDSC